MEINNYIIIGSGCSGAMAAKTIIDAGLQVLILDVGFTSNKAQKPAQSFIDFRNSSENQEETILGSEFEALSHLLKENPLHLTPNRNFVVKQVNELLQWQAGDFYPTESLAKGGLGNAWGLGSYVYSDNELKETGLPIEEMKDAYKWVSNIVGISGGNDDSADYANGCLFTPQKAIPLDFNGESLYRSYSKKQKRLKQNGFIIGRTPLAVSTENEKNGEIYKQDDWDFYNTQPSSGYRPAYTINNLQKENNFKYESNQLVLKFGEQNDIVEVETFDVANNEIKKYYCKKLIICSGTLGTARLVMRSLQIDKLPLISNPYHNIPSFQPRHLGAANIGYQTGLAQLSMYYDADKTHTQIAMGSVYSYRSLMSFRLLKEFPMDSKTGTQFLKLLMPALNITGIFFPEYGSDSKYIERIKDSNSLTSDSLKGTYQLSDKEKLSIKKIEKAFKNALFALGTVPLKVQRNSYGSSIHYGGILPFTHKGKEGLLNNRGHLKGYKNIYIADGSGFTFLSGKGLTLTLMAYAHLVAKNAITNK